MVLSWLKRDARPALRDLARELNIEIVDFEETHYRAAVAAFLRFGKGRHRAALNFADCMAYALAKVSGLWLLYCGTDFSPTNIQSA
jgi:ribonuclease VapC